MAQKKLGVNEGRKHFNVWYQNERDKLIQYEPEVSYETKKEALLFLKKQSEKVKGYVKIEENATFYQIY